MKRSIVLFLLMVMAYGQSANANAAELRSSVVTEESVIRLGDLFSFNDITDAGNAAQKIIGPAPAPGKRKVMNSLQLAAIAKRHGVDWNPSSRYERTVISRSGTFISTEEIEDALTQVMLDKGMGPEQKVRLSNGSRRIYAAVNQDVPFTIENASYNRRTGRITASMHVPYGNGDRKLVSLTGRVLDLMRVPVLSRRVKTGDVIRKADIEWIEIEARLMRDSFITSDDSLIGQQVVRSLTTGRPIRSRDVRSRVLIAKGSLATLTLTTNRMLLTVRVVAMGDGGLGETIRVLNTRSKKTIEGIVTGPGRIVVPAIGLTQGS